MQAQKLNSVHPGEVLLDNFLLPQGETMAHLARSLGEPVSRILELTSGRGRITEGLALKLAQHYGVAANFWLDLQLRFDRRIKAA